MPKMITQEQIIKDFQEVHGDLYDYSKVVYTGIFSKVKIICKKHGEFELIPNKHKNGRGCPECGLERGADFRRLSKEDVIKSFVKVHGEKYDYSKMDYFSDGKKVEIICHIHGSFWQRPGDHKKGRGCEQCSYLNIGWTRTKFAQKAQLKLSYNNCILYVVECFDEKEHFYKIGITTDSIKRRFDTKIKMPYTYSIIKEIRGNAMEIYDLEVVAHRVNKEFKYKPIKEFKGHTECFTKIDMNFYTKEVIAT
jgi:hypothetical protein